MPSDATEDSTLLPLKPPKGAPQARRFKDLRRPERLRTLARAAVGLVLIDGLLIAVYATAPVAADAAASPWWTFLGVVGAFGLALAWQVRAILRSPVPEVRAVTSLLFAIPLFLVLWALAYLSLSLGVPDSFSEELDRVDAIYFSLTIFSTVGFGDITARSGTARMAVSGQMFLGLIVLGVSVRIAVGAARSRLGPSAG